jgi:hypothetical protein
MPSVAVSVIAPYFLKAARSADTLLYVVLSNTSYSVNLAVLTSTSWLRLIPNLPASASDENRPCAYRYNVSAFADLK